MKLYEHRTTHGTINIAACKRTKTKYIKTK